MFQFRRRRINDYSSIDQKLRFPSICELLEQCSLAKIFAHIIENEIREIVKVLFAQENQVSSIDLSILSIGKHFFFLYHSTQTLKYFYKHPLRLPMDSTRMPCAPVAVKH